MMATFSKPRSSSASRIAPTRPSIMSDGATMSAPPAVAFTDEERQHEHLRRETRLPHHGADGVRLPEAPQPARQFQRCVGVNFHGLLSPTLNAQLSSLRLWVGR